MAVTKGQGNPDWTREEVILALDLYHSLDGKIPNSKDERVCELSRTLRAFPHHRLAARTESFRNPAGVAFKLQNLRSVSTGRGLSIQLRLTERSGRSLVPIQYVPMSWLKLFATVPVLWLIF